MGQRQKRVAVIGAGVSGVASARHLQAAGVAVVVYERSKSVGGNWTFDERKPLEPQYPSLKPSIADFVTDDESEVSSTTSREENEHSIDLDKEELRFAPPGPAYSGLMNNVPTTLQEMIGHPWPAGTESYVNVRVKQRYIQSYAKAFDTDRFIKYNTRVEQLRKIGSKWQVRSTTLATQGPERGRKIPGVDHFDAVVVASGHYHASKIPDIPGLKAWKDAWPDRVYHSKSYRNANELKDKTVLLIGAGTSSTDIAREGYHGAKKIYQSSRGGAFDTPLDWLPASVDRVAGVTSFDAPSNSQDGPGTVTLRDGTVLKDIDKVVICTGYLFALPFLANFHDDSLLPEEADDNILVTDGTQIHNLHKDIFYIPDPSLAFVGIPFYTATFTAFEYQAITVAAVLSGHAWTPSQPKMRAEYLAKVKEKGHGRTFHSLMGLQAEYVSDLMGWVNSQAEVTGGAKFEPHSPKWIEESKLIRPRYLKFLETRGKGGRSEVVTVEVTEGS